MKKRKNKSLRLSNRSSSKKMMIKDNRGRYKKKITELKEQRRFKSKILRKITSSKRMNKKRKKWKKRSLKKTYKGLQRCNVYRVMK